MDQRKRPSAASLVAAFPVPLRIFAGLGLLGLCAWFPAMIALFR